jgi:hypothetical protein
MRSQGCAGFTGNADAYGGGRVRRSAGSQDVQDFGKSGVGTVGSVAKLDWERVLEQKKGRGICSICRIWGCENDCVNLCLSVYAKRTTFI